MPGDLFELGREGPEAPDGEQVEPEQRVLAEQGFRDRRRHDPDQVRRSKACGGGTRGRRPVDALPPSQPWRAPVVDFPAYLTLSNVIGWRDGKRCADPAG